MRAIKKKKETVIKRTVHCNGNDIVLVHNKNHLGEDTKFVQMTFNVPDNLQWTKAVIEEEVEEGMQIYNIDQEVMYIVSQPSKVNVLRPGNMFIGE